MKPETVVSGVWNIRKEPYTGAAIYQMTHSTGVKIAVAPMPGYRSAYAVFGTRFGAIDRHFAVGDGSPVTVPDGTAHYLEHKLFEAEERGAFERFAETGADANAYTSYDKTCYLFSCGAENFAPSLEVLLDFVQTPYFTPENVEKERGIIAQELKMGKDSPYRRVYRALIEAMYPVHPIRVEIVGTLDSIQDITPEILYQCYDAFYSPGQMSLAVAGNVDPQEVLDICDRVLTARDNPSVTRQRPVDDGAVTTHLVEQTFDVPVPIFELGFKETWRKLSERELILTDILFDAVFGVMTDFYRRMAKRGLLVRGMGSDYLHYDGVQAVVLAGQSPDPEALRDEIFAEIRRVKEEGVSPELFECARRQLYAGCIEGMESPGSVGDFLLGDLMLDRDSLEDFEIAATVTPEEGTARFREQFDIERCVLSVVRKKEGDETNGSDLSETRSGDDH